MERRLTAVVLDNRRNINLSRHIQLASGCHARNLRLIHELKKECPVNRHPDARFL